MYRDIYMKIILDHIFRDLINFNHLSLFIILIISREKEGEEETQSAIVSILIFCLYRYTFSN